MIVLDSIGIERSGGGNRRLGGTWKSGSASEQNPASVEVWGPSEVSGGDVQFLDGFAFYCSILEACGYSLNPKEQLCTSFRRRSGTH